MGNEISQFVDHDQSIRRTPQTVVDNEHRYDFVATWSTANVHALLRAYTKRATPDGTLGQDKSQRLEDIYQDIVRLETLVESMRLEDAAADVIDTNMTDTPIPHSHVEIGTDVCPAHTLHDIKDTMTPSTPSSQPSTKPLKLKTKPTPKTPEQLQEAFLNSTEAEYVARRHDILLELEAKRRAYRTLAQLPTSLDGIDFSLPVQWSHYFQSVMEVDADAHAGAADNARRLWHPASIGHIMERDPDAPGQLRAFALATAAAAASSANAHAGGDGHTENENASVSDDEDLNSDNEDDKTAAKADGDDAAVETTATTPPEANVVEPRGVLTKRSLDQHTLETAVAAVPLPPLFDPSLRSPVFFGYSVPPPGGPTPSTGPTGSSILPGTHHHDDDDDKVRAAQYFESRLQEIAHRFHDANAIETGKLNALSDRRHAQLERRQKDAAVRQRELDDARKEGVDPTADFFRTAEVTQRQVDIQERAEDDLYESHKNSITSRMHAARVTCDQDTQFLQSLQSPDKPMGAARAAFHTEQLRLHHQSLLSAKKDLVQASTVLDQTKSRSLLQLTSDGAKQQTARGQLLFAEDQVKAAEHTIAVLLSQIDDEEFMLDRGETQIAQEITYFPSFQVFSQDGDTLLDVAFALVVMCAAPLSEKLEYVSQLSETNLLTKPALVQILTVFFRILNRMDQLRTPKDRQTWPVLDQFHLANLVDHMMVGSGGFKAYVTTFEFVSITTDAIQRSKYLSTILRVPWKYQHVSRVQQQAMSALRQFECGLISASDLKYRLARQSIQSAPRGGSSAKEALHVRALAMGSNDPLKADYSKYLKHRRRKVLSNVVPLDHACYKNLIVYRSEVAEKAAIRLQTTWRARQGRVDATMAARKQAFYHAKGTALADARASVEADWRRQEGTTTTLDKMKFDAKIRMRQVKLRTKGLAFSRDDVLRVMTEEAVQDTLEEVDHRFREMEEAAGYCPRVLRFDPLDDAHFSEIAHSLVDQLQRARRPAPATAKLMRAIAEKEIKKEVPETSATWCEPTDKTAVERFHEAVKDLKVQREASHDHMLRGIEPVQATSSERREWMTLMCSNPPLTEWCARLVAICDGMTQLKLTELLMELPSKRHAIAYVRGFHNDIMGAVDRDALVADLMGHFRVLRGVEPLADALIHMATTDMETTWRDDILYHMNAQEAFLVDYVHKSHIKHAGQAARDARQRGRGNTDAKLNMDTQRSMAVDAKARLDDAMVKWKDAEFSYAQAQRRMQLVRDSAVTLVDRRDRMLWAERLKRALETTDKGAHTYIEVVHVCQDFVEVARHVATQIVREYYLPVHEKTVMPVAGPFLMDGRNDGAVRSSHGKGLKFEAHNIRFQVALDDHGRFDHSDELAAKFAGAECRNSSLFLPTMLLTPNVLVPLQCCVDYHGMRVLCVSKLPIECYDVSDKGVVQNVRTEFVYGTNNKGKTIVSHSKTLDASIAKVNASLNLGAHCVRGSLDLTAKLIHGAGDMHGYIGQDETFCLLKFRRMMPPEDPEETPHLPASTRGMSILWRQLRPALVKTHPMPLSPDALSLLTYQTPDWENQAARVKDCTRRMLDDVLPLFARKLAEREDYVTSPTFSLVGELHRHGINVRHLGLLRSLFYFQLDGAVALAFNQAVLCPTVDLTRELTRGDTIYIQGQRFKISEHAQDVVSDKVVTVDRKYTGDSCQNVPLYKGDIQSKHDLRRLILVEMLQRTIKNLVRASLRSMLQARQLAMGPTTQTSLFVVVLNYISGSGAGSDAFWKNQVFDGVRARFGSIAVSFVDRLNLRQAPVEIARYLSTAIGFELTRDCWTRFTQHPHGFLFTIDDIHVDVPCRIRHNLLVLHFAAASMLLDQASTVQRTTYPAAILFDAPCGYWPLNERKGSIVAKNMVSSTDHGKFSPHCTLEAAGPIANDDLGRSVEFSKDGCITFVKAKKWESSATLEAWVLVSASGHGIRAIISHGRYTLAVLKRNVWGAWINMNNIDVVVAGPPVVPDVWTHVATSFDGTALQLYVNGVLYGDLDVRSEVNAQLERREQRFQAMQRDIDDQERHAKDTCMKDVDRECQALYQTKEGKRLLKDLAKKLTDEIEFKARLKKGASSTASPVTDPVDKPIHEDAAIPSKKADMDTMAKKQHAMQTFRKKSESITASYRLLRDELKAKIQVELADALSQDNRPLRIGCVSNACSNSKFFVGRLCHVAFYARSVDRDVLLRHFVTGTLDRAWTSDALFELSAVRFTKALEFAPTDGPMLASFAVNICSALKYDLEQRRSQNMYKAKVRRALGAFRSTENVEGCAEILRNLPHDVRFSDLFREAYACVNELHPTYWTRQSNVSLLELDALPPHFFMSGETKSSSMAGLSRDEVAVYADIIRRVIVEYPTQYGDGLTDLKWICDLETDSVVVYFVLWIRAGEDSRRFDLSGVPDVTDVDMDVVTGANRSCLAFNLHGCVHLTSTTLCTLSLRCSALETLDVGQIPHLTDDVLVALSKTCPNLKAIHMDRCPLISDVGVEALEACRDLREVGFGFCARVTDDALLSLASHTRLSALNVSGCLQLSDFVGLANILPASTTLTSLDISGCRRLTDHGIIAIGTRCTKLTHVNLAFCDKVTDRGIWAITHNCLDLVSLNVQELHLVTDNVFSFDQQGDGRAVVSKLLLAKLRTVVLADCKLLTDTGIAYLLHRARHLQSMDVSGCYHLTNQGLEFITTDIFNGSITGEHLTVLDLSYCMSLSSDGVRFVRERCKQLVTVSLTGCVLLQDAEVIELVKACGKIANLGLGFCRELSDDVLIAISDCLWLDSLFINRCAKMTDVGVCAVASQCTGLLAVNLSSCKRVTDVAVDRLYDNCPKLAQLDVTYCPHVTRGAASRFSIHRPGMVLRTDFESQGSHEQGEGSEAAAEKLFRQHSWKQHPVAVIGTSSHEQAMVDKPLRDAALLR